MHDFLATMEGGGYSSSFAANGYVRDLQQPQQHVSPAPSTVQSRRQTPDLFTSAPLGSSANTGYTPTPYYGGYAGAQQRTQTEGGAVYSAPYGQYDGGAAPPMAGSEGGVASSYGSLAAPAVQVGGQQQSQSQSGYYDGVWRGPSVMQPSHSAPFPPPPPLHQSSPFAPYPSYAPYTPYTSSYSLPTPPAPYAAASSAVKAPPPPQIGELYQPANQAPTPLVPTVDPSHHDSNSFSFLANPSQHSYPPYSPSYPPPPRPPSNIGAQPNLPFPPTTDADAVPGPSGLSQRLGETDLENGGRISTPPVLPTYNLPTASSSSSSSSLAASSSSLLPPSISRAPTPLSLPSHESSRSSSSSRKGKERDTSSPYVNAPHPTQQQQQQQQHVVIAPAPKRRREPKDAAARKYVCQECDQRFARPSALATHILTHTKEKPFICSTCQRGFAVMSNLRRHCRVRNHTLAPSQESHARNRVSTAPPTSSSSGGRSSSHPSVLADVPPGSVRGERLSIDSSSSSGSNGSGAGGSLEGTPLLTTVLPPVMEVGSAGRTQEVYRLGEAVGMKREDSAASLTGTEVLS